MGRRAGHGAPGGHTQLVCLWSGNPLCWYGGRVPGDGWGLSRAWDDGHCHGNGCCPSLFTTHLATLGADLEAGENSGLLILEAPRRSLTDTSTNCSLLPDPLRAGPTPLTPKDRMEVMPLEEAVVVWCALPSPALWFYDILLTF